MLGIRIRIHMFLGFPDPDQIDPLAKRCWADWNFNTNFWEKNNWRLKIMCMRLSCKKEIWKKQNFWTSFKPLKKGVGSGVGSGSGSGSVSQSTDPRIRIGTKMSRIPNTDKKQKKFCTTSLLPSSPFNISPITSKLMPHWTSHLKTIFLPLQNKWCQSVSQLYQKRREALKNQCAGSWSVGSVPYVFGPPGYGSGSFYHQAKIVRRTVTCTILPTVLWLLFNFLSLKNDVKVSSKSNKQKNFLKTFSFFGVLKVNDGNSRIRIQIRIQ